MPININTTSNQNVHASSSIPTCDPFKSKELSLKPVYYHCIRDILSACSNVCLFVCIVALRPKSTAMVIAGRSVHLTTLFSGQA